MFQMRVGMAILIAGVTLAACGCGKGRQDEAAKRELVLLSGSSFLPAARALADEFTRQSSIEVVSTSGESEDLLPLVKAGRKGDIFVTHDPYLDYVREAGVLADSVHVGYVAPVLVVRKGNPKKLTAIADLTRPGLKVALSDPKYSTCGQLVFRLLEKKGIKDAVMKNVGNRLTKGHHRLGTLVKTETVDAVIMWNGVAHNFADSTEIVPTPYEYDEEIRVHVMSLNYSKHPAALKEFMDFARRRGPEIFKEFGYVK